MLNNDVKNTKQQILEGTYDFLIKNGLENATIRNICKHIGYSRGAVTHYYENKDDMLCRAAEYGLKKMSDDIFDYFFNHLSSIDHFFENCTKSIDFAKDELRFIYQMAASPVYGKMLRNSNHKFIYIYDEYAERLARETGGNIKEIKPIIYLFAASIIDYVIWQNKDEVQIQLEFICKQLKKAIGQNK